MAGFISEWWPGSNRNGGRHQIGIPGRIASEFAQNGRFKHREAEEVRHRFFELDESLQDAVVWTSLLDKIAEEMSALPSMSKREVNIALGQLDRVTDELKRAIEQMDAIYNNHTKEEALT